MRRPLRTLFLLTLLVSTSWIQAQEAAKAAEPEVLRLEEGATPAPAKIGDLAWMAGYWRGTGLGGRCEEVWGQPNGDRMHGFFTLDNDKGPVFSEAMMLVEEEGSVVMKIRHFDPKFIPWEDKDEYVTFRLVRLGQNEAFFSGLTVRREGDRLRIFLRFKSEGAPRIETFDFQRLTF